MKPASSAAHETGYTWAGANAYERYMGRWSRGAAAELVRWLDLPPGLDWVEVGCGTGALTAAIVELAAPRRVRAFDLSADYLAAARERVRDARVEFGQADARSLPEPAGSADVAVGSLVLNFVPEPAAAVAEMRRVVRAGGTVAASVWDYAEGMELIRAFWDAALELDPAAAALDEGRRFPLCRPEPLRQLFAAAGLHEVEVVPVVVPTHFASFDDLWEPFLGGQGPAPGYAVSLDDDRRAELRTRLERRLPRRPDGSISLEARAWAARGRA